MLQILEHKSESQVYLLPYPSHIIDNLGVFDKSDYKNYCDRLSQVFKASGTCFGGSFCYMIQHRILMG